LPRRDLQFGWGEIVIGVPRRRSIYSNDIIMHMREMTGHAGQGEIARIAQTGAQFVLGDIFFIMQLDQQFFGMMRTVLRRGLGFLGGFVFHAASISVEGAVCCMIQKMPISAETDLFFILRANAFNPDRNGFFIYARNQDGGGR
jgi:hypothetical protein